VLQSRSRKELGHIRVGRSRNEKNSAPVSLYQICTLLLLQCNPAENQLGAANLLFVVSLNTELEKMSALTTATSINTGTGTSNTCFIFSSFVATIVLSFNSHGVDPRNFKEAKWWRLAGAWIPYLSMPMVRGSWAYCKTGLHFRYTVKCFKSFYFSFRH
jgi:hypothetical protein